MDFSRFESRKRDHLRHALDPSNQASGLSRLDSVRLIHEALPEFDFAEVKIDSMCLGKESRTPYFIPGMTAGHADGDTLNRTLAVACSRRGWAMGTGSLRRELEGGERALIHFWRDLRRGNPDLLLIANLGISQAITADVSRIAELVETIGAGAIAIHANALQECLQPEGTPQFRGSLEALGRIARELSVPVLLKETGCGFSSLTLKRVSGLGLAAVDVSGLGGTHWGRIEGARSKETGGETSDRLARAAQVFEDWGISTVDSVKAAVEALDKKTETWASGGVRTGLDAAKLLALGAVQVGFAKPALEAALAGPSALEDWMQQQEFELRVALFCTGSKRPLDLRGKAWSS